MEIDLIPLAQLPSRYGIARSNVYNRLKDLKIETTKQGKKAFISAAQLELLDRLHLHLERGGITPDFLKQQGTIERLTTIHNTPTALYTSREEPTIVLQPSVLVNALEAVIKRLIPTSKSRLSYLRDLEEAYQNGWLLSTSEVAELLGLSQKTITGYGEEFTDAGFLFARVGIRKGGEIAWSIDKDNSWAEPLPSPNKSIKFAFSSDFDPD
jgi:predicted DNA-binding transcriptional regulator AlpA